MNSLKKFAIGFLIFLLLVAPSYATITLTSNSGLTSGVTPISGGTDTRVCFDDGGFLNCNDAGFTYAKAGGTVTITGQYVAANGSKSAPTYAFAGLLDRGFFYQADGPTISSGNQEVVVFNGSSGPRLPSNLRIIWVNNASVVNGQTEDTGIVKTVPGVVSISSGNVGTAAGFMRSPAGDLSLNAAYTNATASFTNTNLITPLALVSGRTYSFKLVAFFSDSTAADGAQFDFNANALSVTNFQVICYSSNNVGAALTLTNASSTTLATAVQVTLALTTDAQITCEGTIVPSANGNFGFRAAQTAHSTGTLTIRRGSKLSIQDANPL